MAMFHVVLLTEYTSSQLIRFARVCSHVDDFNTRNKCLTAKLLKQGYRYHNLRKAFSDIVPIEGTSVVLSLLEGEMSRIWYQNNQKYPNSLNQ